MQLFHGTRSKIEIFDKSKAGQSSKTAKIGFWFTDRDNFANNFANNIWWGEEQEAITMPVYVSMKKPKVYKKRNVSEQELQQAEKRVDEIENKIKDLKKLYNQTVMKTGSFAQASKYTEQAEQLRKSDLKQAKAEYAELRYVDPYELLRTDIYKIEGKNAEDANFGGIGTSLNNQDETIEKFVKSLKEQGYDGIIIQGTTFDSEEAEAKTNNQYVVFNPEQIKSVDNRGTFDTENPNIYYQNEIPQFQTDNNFDLNKYLKSLNVKKNIKQSSDNFAQQLNNIEANLINSEIEPIVLFKPTVILTRVGLENSKITFSQSKIKKVIKKHGLSYDELKKIPELLANPEYIFESATDENGFVVVLNKEEKPLVVALTKVGKNLKVKNIIKSAYNKGSNFINNNIKEERLLYDKSNPTRFRQHRAPIAQAKTLSDINNVTNSQNNFNPNIKKHEDVLYQTNENQQEPLIAGYTAQEIFERLQALEDEYGDFTDNTPKEIIDNHNIKIQVLSDALEYMFKENRIQKDFDEIAYNTFHIMNNAPLPEAFVEANKKTQRTIRDYKDGKQRYLRFKHD